MIGMSIANDDADDVISCWHRHTYSNYLGDFFSKCWYGGTLPCMDRWARSRGLPACHFARA